MYCIILYCTREEEEEELIDWVGEIYARHTLLLLQYLYFFLGTYLQYILSARSDSGFGVRIRILLYFTKYLRMTPLFRAVFHNLSYRVSMKGRMMMMMMRSR